MLKDKADARLLYTELLQIPLLPAENIEDGFREIKGKAGALGLSHGFRDLFKYFENYWLNVVSIKIWFQMAQSFYSFMCFRTLKTRYL